jgi:hypothetical protein
MPYLVCLRLTDDLVVNLHRLLEIKLHMDKHITELHPINLIIEKMLKILASSVVEQVTLRSVVDMVKRIEVAHPNLNRAREHVD